MKNITKRLQESASKAGAAIRKDLLNFVNAKSPEFEAAQDATAIETILNAAVSANSITQEGKSILFNAVQKYLAMDIQPNQLGMANGDPSEAGTPNNDQPKISEIANGNTDQPT